MPDTAVIRAQWYPCFVTPRFLTTTARRVDTFLQARGVVARDRKMPRVSEVGQSVGRKRETEREKQRERKREREREGGRKEEGRREKENPAPHKMDSVWTTPQRSGEPFFGSACYPCSF